jgi:hypothetical protein
MPAVLPLLPSGTLASQSPGGNIGYRTQPGSSQVYVTAQAFVYVTDSGQTIKQASNQGFYYNPNLGQYQVVSGSTSAYGGAGSNSAGSQDGSTNSDSGKPVGQGFAKRGYFRGNCDG